jgi:hypothetical protein
MKGCELNGTSLLPLHAHITVYPSHGIRSRFVSVFSHSNIGLAARPSMHIHPRLPRM